MIRDVYLQALRTYEREVAPAYEVIRRARARLRDQVVGPLVDSIDTIEDPFWAGDADPTEPNGAELAVEGAIDQPASVPPSGAGEPASGDSPPVAVTPAAEQPRRRRAASADRDESPAGEGATADGGQAVSEPEAPPAASPFPCSCGRSFETQRGLSKHRNASGHAPPRRPAVVAPASAVETDKRILSPAIECDRGCGRRFTWEPSLVSHWASCDGVPRERPAAAAVPGFGQ